MTRKGRRAIALGAFLFVFAVTATPLMSQEKGGENETGPYELVENWPPNPCGDGYQMGSVGGVFAERPDRIYVFQRGCLPEVEPSQLIPNRNASGYDLSREDKSRWPRWDHVLMILDRDGKVVDSWDQHNHHFVRPHRVLQSPYDPDRNVWLIDDGAHQVFKFTNDGKKLLMTLGEFRVPGNDQTHFNRPTDIAWLPNGDFYVSDGYGNSRVVKFSKDGKYLMEWGKPSEGKASPGPGEMRTVHGIAIDDQRRVYVIDRSNSRIQIFDENGKFLDIWPNMRRPYYIYMARDQHLWASDGITQKMLKYDLKGKLLYSWGTFGAFPGGFWGVHQFDVDSEGNLYTADVHVGRLQKFRPKPGADPATLVGERLMPARSTN